MFFVAQPGGQLAKYSVMTPTSSIPSKSRRIPKMRRVKRQETLEDLAGNLAHDLNNALVPVTMSAQLLRPKVTDPDGRRCLDLLDGGAWRCAEIVRDLLVRPYLSRRTKTGKRRAGQPRSQS